MAEEIFEREVKPPEDCQPKVKALVSWPEVTLTVRYETPDWLVRVTPEGYREKGMPGGYVSSMVHDSILCEADRTLALHFYKEDAEQLAAHLNGYQPGIAEVVLSE